MPALINPSDRIFVAGHRGMAGGAIVRALQQAGYQQVLTARRSELNLENPLAVHGWFEVMRPDVVVLAAGTVGGVHPNSTRPADALLNNLKIQSNVIESAWRSGARRLLLLGCSSAYPQPAQQPPREEALLSGALEPTQEWQAIARIAGIKLCQALRLQHGFDAISLMPANLYGPGDHYHPINSHVLPAMILRFHDAVRTQAASVTCWGTGTPRRDFLHVDDLGEACVFALERWQPRPEEPPWLNVGTGTDISIRELAEQVAAAFDYRGEILWDTARPDGAPRNCPDVNRLAAMGWTARIPFSEGLRHTVSLFQQTVGVSPLPLQNHADIAPALQAP